MASPVINQPGSLLTSRKWVVWVILVVLFGLGALIRFYDLTDAPLDFHPTRQLHSALIARGMAALASDLYPAQQAEIAIQQWKLEGLIEPPIMERLTAFTYLALGREVLWAARIYAILFWLLGGVGLYLLVKELKGIDAAIIALIFYLFLPYSALASRAFQPDLLLVCSIIWAWWAAVKWARYSSWKWTVVAGLLSGFAIFVKSTAVFFLFGAYIGLVLFGKGIRFTIKDKRAWLLVLLAVLPYAAFHIYGVYITGQLASQFSMRFFPQLWLQPAFYLQWIGQVNGTVGFPFFLAAILGIFLLPEKSHRAMLAGVLLGYFLYGMTFTHHITTHDYYHLPLVPLVAAGVGIALSTLARQLLGPKWLTRLILIAVLLGWIGVNAWDVRVTLKRNDYRPEAAIWKELGETLGQGTSVVGLLHDYGYRLEYWGWVTTSVWFTSGDLRYRELAGQTFDFDTLFIETTAGKQYFVVTLFGEYDSQPELKGKLEKGYPVYKQTGDYLIFDLMHPLKEQR
ncbi:MAG TPA: glycosyltransferase family 39 protein [Anaerolineaceae bacterium]|nr:glycosyltransferase family 39 protein [Anaerolineaceae bacterium]HQP07674.1 glycosyltransferase family 39 protein [Anaerolineaceae bacterium]